MGREETTWRTESLVKEINHREMFDLNLGDDSNNSNVSSSVVNVEDSNSSSAGHDQNHKTVINFLSLNDKKNEKNNIFVEVDDVSSNNEHEELIARQFFPVNQGPVEAWKAGELRLNLAEDHGLGVAKPSPPPVPVKKSRRGPRSRSSQYRGVTFYRRTGRWESHIWDCGKQVYLGGFDTAHVAARAYDRAAIKFRGVDADINFLVSDYEEDINRMRNLTKDEFVQILRRQSSGSGRGSSKYRGVTSNKCGGWEARMGHFLGKKPCDLVAFRCNGKEAMTNFETRNYPGEITFAAGNGGPSENLDLNLSVSTPSAAMVHKNLRTVQFQPTALELPNFRQRVLTGMHVAEANRLFGGSNQAEKLPNHGAVNSVPVFSSAASSGFSSTASPHVTSLRHLRVPNMFPQNSVVFTLQNHQATFNANRKN